MTRSLRADSLAHARDVASLGHDASLGARWRRRAITLPSLFLTCALAWSIAPIVLALSALYDLVSGARFARTRGMIAVLVFFLAECMGVIASSWLFVFTRPGTERWTRAHVLLQRWWATTLFRSLEKVFSLEVRIEAERGPDGPSVCLVRHASLADTLVPVVLAAGRWDLAPSYALKRELLADPCLDIVGQRLSNAFLTRKAESAGEDARAIAALAAGLADDGTLVIYPEGTLFSPAKLAKRLDEVGPERRARLEALARVLPPRPRGVIAALRERPDACVLVIAHTGLEPLRSLRDLFDGSLIGRRFDVSIRYAASSEVPREPDDLTRWLDEEWLRIDAWVGQRRI